MAFMVQPRFHMAAKKSGIRAHVGTELSVTDEPGTSQLSAALRIAAGYQNLCRLITRTKLRVPKHSESSAQFDELEEHAAGLICLTGDEHGPLAHALRTGGMDAGRKLLKKLEGDLRPKQCIRGVATPFPAGAGTAQSMRNRTGA